MKIKKIVLILSLFIFLVLSTATEARDFKNCPKFQHKREMEEIINSLNLTEEQKTQIKQLRSEQREQFKETHIKMQELQEQLRNELDKPKINETEIKRITDQIKQLHAQLLDNRVNSSIKMRQILTEEQYNTFKEKTREKIKRKKMWMEKRGDLR